MTYLGTWSTYYVVTGTGTPHSNGDAYGGFAVYYEYEPTNLRYKIQVNCLLRRYPSYEGSLPSNPYYVPYVTGNIRPTINGTTGSQVSYTKDGYYKASNSEVDTIISTQYFYANVNTSDGTASVSLSGRFYGQLYNGAVSATRTCSHTWSLPTVAVMSSITNNTTSSSRITFGSNVNFTITPPSGSSFTHTLTYVVNNTTYTIANSSSLTSINYTFPTSLINSFTTTSTPSITVNCASSNGTTSSTEVYLQVPDNDTYRPTVSIALQDVMVNKPSSLNGLWIKNKSLLKGTITATAKNGASISSYLSSISGFSTQYNTNPFTTQPLTVAGNRTVTYSAKDSRGLTGVGTQSINVVDYNNPSISSAKIERCRSDGTLDETGTYGKVTVTYSISPLNDGSSDKNTKSLTVKKGSGTAQTITTTNYSGTVSQVFNFSLTELSTDEFTFTLTDIFGSITYKYTIGVAFKTVSKRAGGKGIAFGKVATEDKFDVNMQSKFEQPMEATDINSTNTLKLKNSNVLTENNFAKNTKTCQYPATGSGQSGSPTYYLLAKLPATANTTHPNLGIEGFIGVFTKPDSKISISITNKNGVQFQGYYSGDSGNFTNTCIVIYKQSNNEHWVYLKRATNYENRVTLWLTGYDLGEFTASETASTPSGTLSNTIAASNLTPIVANSKFSTSETIIGTWTGGQTIYRKVITTTGNNSNMQTIGSVGTGKTIINMYGTVIGASQTREVVANYYGSTAWASQLYYDTATGNMVLECGNDYKSFKNGRKINVVIEYY